jgi:hypothetical protein
MIPDPFNNNPHFQFRIKRTNFILTLIGRIVGKPIKTDKMTFDEFKNNSHFQFPIKPTKFCSLPHAVTFPEFTIPDFQSKKKTKTKKNISLKIQFRRFDANQPAA